VMSLSSMKTRELLARVPVTAGRLFAWSPDSQQIAFPILRAPTPDEQNRHSTLASDIEVVTIATGHVERLGAGLSRGVSGAATPLWSMDSTRIYATTTERQLVEISRRQRTARVLSSLSGSVLGLVSPNESRFFWEPTRGAAWVLAGGGTRAGIYEIDLARDSARLMVEQPEGSPPVIDASAASASIAMVRAPPQLPRELLVWRGGTGEPRRVGALNAFLSADTLGTARRISWRTEAGSDLAGALLLPPGYRAGDRLPLIVWVYGGDSGTSYMNRFGFWDHPAFNMQVLATRGYAVLYPDTPLRRGTPMKDLVADVMPGVDAAIAAGYADPERLAVMGQSYGSYSVLALITHTNRFKAAVITAVVHPDLLAYYLIMHDSGGSSGHFLESGGGYIAATPWAAPDLYRDNSPIYGFDKISTPVLIGQGDDDPLSTIGADSVFVALNRLGKPVEYRRYKGERHAISQPANVVDFWQRRLDFLATNLDIALDPDDGRVILDNGRVRARGPHDSGSRVGGAALP